MPPSTYCMVALGSAQRSCRDAGEHSTDASDEAGCRHQHHFLRVHQLHPVPLLGTCSGHGGCHQVRERSCCVGDGEGRYSSCVEPDDRAQLSDNTDDATFTSDCGGRVQ